MLLLNKKILEGEERIKKQDEVEKERHSQINNMNSEKRQLENK